MRQQNQLSTKPRLPYLEERQRAFATYQGATMFNEESIESSDGVPLTVLHAGDPERPSVLLVNALGVSCVFLTAIARRLATRYYVLTWESRGLPDDSLLLGRDADFSVKRHCLDAAHILARKHLRADAVVAYCSGANIAVYGAAEGIVNAKRLCIISPSMQAGAVAQTDYQRTMLPMWEKIAHAGPRYAALVRVLLQQNTKADDGSIDYELSCLNNLPFRSNESTYRYARLQAACMRLDWPQLLRRVRAPTLVLHGEQDDVIHVETSAAVARGIAGAVFRTVPAGHFAVYTSSGLHEEVMVFLDGLEQAPAPTAWRYAKADS